MRLTKKTRDFINKTKKSDWLEYVYSEVDEELFYHISPARANVVDWLSIKEDDKVLLIGNDSVAVLDCLRKKAAQVQEIDLIDKSTYEKVNHFNIVICFNYLEFYGLEEFRNLLSVIKTTTKLIIIEHNQLDLRYFNAYYELGEKEFYTLCNSYRGTERRRYSKKELDKILSESLQEGEVYKSYYAYPDEKFTTYIFSDDRMPIKGELSDNVGGLNRKNSYFYSQHEMNDMMIEDELIKYFFGGLVYIINSNCEDDVIFVKPSMNRRDDFCITTEMVNGEDGVTIRKRALTQAAITHLRNVYEKSNRLSEMYTGTDFIIPKSTICGNELLIEYVEGDTFEEYLDKLLEEGKTEQFENEIVSMCKRVTVNNGDVIDIDLIFSNIICMANGKKAIIDYEWTFDVAELETKVERPWEYVWFRAIDNYVQKMRGRFEIDENRLLDSLGIAGRIAEFKLLEKSFQNEVYDDERSIDVFKVKMNAENYKFPDEYVLKTEFDSMVYEKDLEIQRKSQENHQIYQDFNGKIQNLNTDLDVVRNELREIERQQRKPFKYFIKLLKRKINNIGSQ